VPMSTPRNFTGAPTRNPLTSRSKYKNVVGLAGEKSSGTLYHEGNDAEADRAKTNAPTRVGLKRLPIGPHR